MLILRVSYIKFHPNPSWSEPMTLVLRVRIIIIMPVLTFGQNAKNRTNVQVNCVLVGAVI